MTCTRNNLIQRKKLFLSIEKKADNWLIVDWHIDRRNSPKAIFAALAIAVSKSLKGGEALELIADIETFRN